MARAGVTGTKTKFDQSVIDYFTRLRGYSRLPIALGFGISSANDLNFLCGYADYAVIGTQTLRSYQEKGLGGVEDLWQALSEGTPSGRTLTTGWAGLFGSPDDLEKFPAS